MRRSVMVKLVAIAVLALLLLVALFRIEGLVSERESRRDEAVTDIAAASAKSQRIVGPLLVVPYKKVEREWIDGQKGRQWVERQVEGQLYIAPAEFGLSGDLTTEERKRGIYSARLYHLGAQVSGRFSIPEQLGISDDYADYTFGTPYVSMGISDIRGIEDGLTLTWNDTPLPFAPGARVQWNNDGVHADVRTMDVRRAGEYRFSFNLRLLGTNNLKITPVGKVTVVSLKSTWPNPSFDGEFLPTERQVDSSGFTASWRSTFFSTNFAEVLTDCEHHGNCVEVSQRQFGVSLIDPVDQYLKVNRASKYAMLFIVLTFAGFFLFEVLKHLDVHPMQYGMVGFALALFYLLLLSLSEHVDFLVAYAVSAAACVGLLGVYVGAVLRHAARGVGFAAALLALYALLYCILNAEDYALLMGSVLLFGVLAVVMIMTRHVNWSHFSTSDSGGPTVSRDFR